MSCISSLMDITQLRKPLPGKKVRQFTIYLPEEIDQALRNLAHAEQRTLTTQTAIVMREGLRILHRKRQRE